MSPAPPRGMTRSMSPRACRRWPTTERSVPGTSWMAGAGQAGLLGRAGQDLGEGLVAAVGAGRAAQQGGVAALERDAGGIDGDVGAALVDHRDHAERDADLADLQAVGAVVAAHDLADGIGQGGQRAQAVGHRGHPRLVEGQAVDHRLGRAVGPRGLDVLGVGGQDVGGAGIEGVGHRVQRGVLVGPGGRGQFDGRVLRAGRQRADVGFGGAHRATVTSSEWPAKRG